MGISIIVNESVLKSPTALITTSQAVAGQVTAHKAFTLYSAHLPPCNSFKYNPGHLQVLWNSFSIFSLISLRLRQLTLFLQFTTITSGRPICQ